MRSTVAREESASSTRNLSFWVVKFTSTSLTPASRPRAPVTRLAQAAQSMFATWNSYRDGSNAAGCDAFIGQHHSLHLHRCTGIRCASPYVLRLGCLEGAPLP